MLRRILSTALILFSSFLIFTAQSNAQSAATGTISGSVVDASHNALPGAEIRLRNTDTGAERILKSNDSGNYTAAFLEPGHYEAIATHDGFAKANLQNLLLTVGQSLTLDITLPLASVQATVTVSAAAPLLDTDKTEVSQTVGEKFISNLPVASRNWSSFVLATPNVTTDGSSGLVSYRGISGLYNSNLVDGANNNQALFSESRGRASGAPYVYSLDSIKEFQVDTAVYSAEFGQAAGGQVNAVTRSGTNETHGDLFYYFRYPSLNALDPFNKAAGLAAQAQGQSTLLLNQPVHQQHQFGGSAGGPILHDKLFYFFTYDGFRKVAPIFYSSNAEISLTPDGPFNSSSQVTPAQCPTTISAGQCTAAITYLLSLNGSYPRVQKQDIFFPRLDYQLNEKNHISANFNWGDFKSPNGYSGGPSYTNTSVTTNGSTNYHERFFIANWTSVLSNASVNELRFQWGRDLETAGVNAPGPSVSLGNLQTYGMPNALPRTAEPDEHRIQFTDVFSTTRGHHTLKAGGDLNLVHEVMINLFQGGGIYSYSGAGTATGNFQNWVQDVFPASESDPAAGTHYTSFTQVYDPITHVGKDDFWMKNWDWFAEDTWKVLPNLTLNLGVRYDLQITPQPTHPNTSSELATLYTQSLKTVKDRVVPRVGIAWTPNPGTVFRAGFGVFGALTQGSTYYAMRVENGVYQTNYNFNSPTAPGAPVFPNVLFTPPGPALAAPFSGAAVPQVTPGGSALVTSFHGLDPNFVPPIAYESQLGMEQQFPGKLTLSVGYVGSRALHLPIFIDSNLAPASSTRVYDVVSASGDVKQRLTLPFYTARLTPLDGSINTGFSAVNSWYNSMAVTVKRPFDHGLELLMNYTWAKATDLAQVQGAFGTFYGSDFPIDPQNIKREQGRSDLDQRGRFVGTLVYQPLFFHSMEFKPAKYALDGFIFSGTYTSATGFPVTANLSAYPGSSRASAAFGGVDGGLTGGVMSSSSGSASAGRAPQVTRNAYPGPGLQNLDFRVTRDFQVREAMHFQFFAEAFNLLNHTNVLSVNTTAFQYVAPGAALPKALPTDPTVTCAATSAGDPTFNGCVAPYFSSSAPFGSRSSTSGTLYGARQLQLGAKFFF